MRLHLKNMNEHDTFKQKVTNVRFTVILGVRIKAADEGRMFLRFQVEVKLPPTCT